MPGRAPGFGVNHGWRKGLIRTYDAEPPSAAADAEGVALGVELGACRGDHEAREGGPVPLHREPAALDPWLVRCAQTPGVAAESPDGVHHRVEHGGPEVERRGPRTPLTAAPSVPYRLCIVRTKAPALPTPAAPTRSSEDCPQPLAQHRLWGPTARQPALPYTARMHGLTPSPGGDR